MAAPYADDRAYLADELGWLDTVLRAAVVRAARRGPPATGACASAQAAARLLEGASRGDADSAEERRLLEEAETRRSGIAKRLAATEEAGTVLRLPRLVRLFSLEPFEAELISVCLAAEVDLRYPRLYGFLQDDAAPRGPSVSMVFDLLCGDAREQFGARSALAPSGRLFRYGLLRSPERGGPALPLLARTLRLDDGVASHLLGSDELDARLARASTLIPPRGETPADDALGALSAAFAHHVGDGASHRQWVAVLHGPDANRRDESARELCSRAGIPLLRVDAEALLESEADAERASRLALREAALKGGALYLDFGDSLSRDAERGPSWLRGLERALSDLGWATSISSREPVAVGDALKRQRFFSIEHPLPPYRERKRLWSEALTASGLPASEFNAAGLASQFRFTRREITNAIEVARSSALLRRNGTSPTQKDLEAACRAESAPQLVSFARRMQSGYGWDDLILPASQRGHLREAVEYIRRREVIHGEWGFGQAHALGRGTNVLFSGPSGTGKTMAAGILARELGLELYKIDLSTVVSKYIGETEKNLSRIFFEAERSSAILFFDEADALFGRRSEVKDSHDRYANIEVNYLLQKMEEHDGVVILASNFTKNLDDAFMRRIQFSVAFPLPEKEERLQLWRRAFPAEAPLAKGID